MIAPRFAGLLVVPELFGADDAVPMMVTVVPVVKMVEPSDVKNVVKVLVEDSGALVVPLALDVEVGVGVDPVGDVGLEIWPGSLEVQEVVNSVAVAEVNVVGTVTVTGTWMVVTPPAANIQYGP